MSLPLSVPQTEITPRGLLDRAWRSFFVQAGMMLTALASSGATSERPTPLLWVGRPYFDTTLGKAVWYKSKAEGWVESHGSSA